MKIPAVLAMLLSVWATVCDATPQSSSASGSPGRWRTSGGVGGHVGAPHVNRQDALAALGNTADVESRRLGARALGDTGVMADVPILVRALRDTDPLVRTLAEQSLWQVWSRSGDAEVDDLLARGIAQMTTGDGTSAVETFTRVIERRPDFAEGWNKRATIHYLMGEYRKSLADCDEVMKRNPYHFGALSGYGLIYLRLDQPARALEYFERALAVNPNMDQMRQTVDGLRETLMERRKNTL